MHSFIGSDTSDDWYEPSADLNADGEVDSSDFVRLGEVGCPADYNDDDVVDDADYLYFAVAYNNLIDIDGDFNGDGMSEDADAVLFNQYYNNLICPSREPAYVGT